MNFPYGEIETNPPPEFMPPETWPEYGNIATPPGICKREEVGTHPRGIRWSLWPLCFEKYVGDEEPSLEDSKKGELSYNRMIMWDRVTRTDVPSGWKQRSNSPWRIDGYAHATSSYQRSWNKSVIRKLHTWQKLVSASKYLIEEISFAEYVQAYKKSIVKKRFGGDLLEIFTRKYTQAVAREHFQLLAVRNTHTKQIIAGAAILYSPTHRAAIRECPFTLPEAKHVHAATGLIDHWFAECQKKNIKTLVFTYFWYPGCDKSWKGFSEFKSHFGLRYVAYPPSLYRFVRGKFW